MRLRMRIVGQIFGCAKPHFGRNENENENDAETETIKMEIDERRWRRWRRRECGSARWN